MKHILFILSHLDPKNCGIADYFHHIIPFLKPHFRISVITEKGMKQYAPDHCTVYEDFEHWDFSDMHRIKNIIQKCMPDIIHLQYTTSLYKSRLMINLLPWYLKTNGIRIPFVTTFHDLRGPFLMPKLGPFKIRLLPTMFLFNSIDRAIITNNFDYTRLHRFWFVKNSTIRQKVRKIPVGSNVSPSEYSEKRIQDIYQRFSLKPEDLKIVFFGFIIFGKGIECLVETIALLKQRGMSAKLLLVGRKPDYNSELMQILSNIILHHNLEHDIIFTDYVENVSDYIYSADVVALPFEEGLTLRRTSYITAISHGAPVLTTRSSVLPAFIRPDRHAVMVSYGNCDETADALLRIHTDPELKTRLKKEGKKLSRRFAFNKISAQHKKVYDEF